MMFDNAKVSKTQLEQMGDDLHECQSCLQSILTRNLNGILITDLDWIVLFANPVAECFFNVQERGLLGTQFNFSLAPGEAKELKVRSQGGQSIVAEMWMVDIEWAGKPAIFISIHDISERKRNDYERRKMYQAMMQSPNTVMITDNDGVIEDVNPRFTELTGYEADEVIGKNPRFLQSGLTPPERYRELWEALTHGREWRGEFINKKKNGEFYTESASIAPITNFDGTVTHFVAVKDDISARKKAEETLAISEIRYRRLFETTGDGILILEAESGRIIDVNPMLVEMLGYTGENFIGKKLWDFGVFADIEASKASFKELQHEEYIRYEDLPFETKDGRQIFVEFISKVYLSDGKKLIQCNIRDITERKQAQEKIAQLDVELAKRAAELEATNQELEAFNYTVAHKLRQPLNVISSYCQAVIEICNNKLDKQCQRYLQEIY